VASAKQAWGSHWEELSFNLMTFSPILLVYPHINLLLNKRDKDEVKQKTKKISDGFKGSEESQHHSSGSPLIKA
jgi:hypothetical protein